MRSGRDNSFATVGDKGEFSIKCFGQPKSVCVDGRVDRSAQLKVLWVLDELIDAVQVVRLLFSVLAKISILTNGIGFSHWTFGKCW